MKANIIRSLLVSLVLSAIGLAWIVFSVGEPSDLLVILELPPFYGTAAILATAAAFGLGGARLVFVCRRMDFSLRFRNAVRTHILGMFSATVTPGGAGNTPAIALVLQHHGASSSAAWAVGVAIFRADAIFHAWGLPFALVALYALGTIPSTGTWMIAGGAAIVLTSTLAWLMQFKLHWLRPIAETILRGPLLRFRRRGLRFIDDMLSSDKVFAEAPAWWQVSVQAYTAASWIALFSVLWLLARGLDVQVGPVEAIAMQLVVMTTSVLVPTPGGSGFFELGISYLLLAEGGGANVPAVVLLWRLITFYSTFVLGPLLGGYLVAQRLQQNQSEHGT